MKVRRTGIRENTITTQFDNMVKHYAKLFSENKEWSVAYTVENLMCAFEALDWVFSAQPIPREQELINLERKLAEQINENFGFAYMRVRVDDTNRR